MDRPRIRKTRGWIRHHNYNSTCGGSQIRAAGSKIGGVGSQIIGAGSQIRGAGSQIRGAGSQNRGAGSQNRGAGSQNRGAGSETRRDPAEFNHCIHVYKTKTQDTRANPNSWQTHLLRKRWDTGLLRALSLGIVMMMYTRYKYTHIYTHIHIYIHVYIPGVISRG